MRSPREDLEKVASLSQPKLQLPNYYSLGGCTDQQFRVLPNYFGHFLPLCTRVIPCVCADMALIVGEVVGALVVIIICVTVVVACRYYRYLKRRCTVAGMHKRLASITALKGRAAMPNIMNTVFNMTTCSRAFAHSRCPPAKILMVHAKMCRHFCKTTQMTASFIAFPNIKKQANLRLLLHVQKLSVSAFEGFRFFDPLSRASASGPFSMHTTQ